MKFYWTITILIRIKNIKLSSASIRLIRVISVLLLLFVSCAPRDRDTDHIQIEFWTLQLSPTFNEYFHNLIDEFESIHPGVKVRWVDVPYDLGMQRFLTGFASGRAPDVINLSSDFLAKAVVVDALLPVRPEVIGHAGIEYFPAALETGIFNNTIYALPWYLNTYVTIYNTRMLAEAGFDADNLPETFGGYLELAREYHRRTGRHAFFLTIGKDSFLPMILESEGVSLFDEPGARAAFNSPRGVEIVDQWVQAFREGAFPREAISSRATAIAQPYQSGLVASVFTGPVFLRHIRDNAPAIYAETDVAPPLTGESGRHELAVMSIAVSSQTKHPDIATDFALFVTNAHNQTKFARQTLIFPSTPESLDDPHFHPEGDALDARAIRIAVESLPEAERLRTYFNHPMYDRLQDIFDEAIQRACLGRMSTQEALDWAVLEWDRLLE